MDALLTSLGMYAVNCAGRLAVKNGIAFTARFTTKQCTRLLKTIDDQGDRTELKRLQRLLKNNIRILSPVIDLIELRSGRGNVFLESAVPLVKSLQRDIMSLGKRLEVAAAVEEAISRRPGTRSTRVAEQQHAEMMGIIAEIKDLLVSIDKAIPLLQLAITGSGETLSSSMPPGVSPSRFLQASAFVNLGDCQFSCDPTRPVQIGPAFTLSLYMLFVGHSSADPTANGGWNASRLPATPNTTHSGKKKREKQEPYGLGEGERKPIWQEVIHKARIRICRTPVGWTFDRQNGYSPDPSAAFSTSSAEAAKTAFAKPLDYAYHLEVVEDLDDGRLHEEDGPKHQPFDNIAIAGVRESMSIREIAKLFYTNTGRLLNVGSSTENNPVLLLKRDVTASSPRQVRDEGGEGPFNAHVEEGPESEASESDDDDQSDVDRQLFEEGTVDTPQAENVAQDERTWQFPHHVDPEWLALEVYMEDDDDDSSDEDEDDADHQRSDSGIYDDPPNQQLAVMKRGHAQRGSSVDNNLLEQIRNISIRPPLPSSPQVAKLPRDDMAEGTAVTDSPESFVARSPFGAITSSLSLMEMLIRLTSLQEWQQTSHLASTDTLLNFFLEETSTTGLSGEERYKGRNEAKRRMGFDPYTDVTPVRKTEQGADGQ